MSTAIDPSALIFPEAATIYKSTLSSLKRSNLSIKNRLTSILHDAQFVANTAKRFQLPLVANERCGSWYVPPELKQGSAYFKSTDGHFGQWSFSLRRLNLQVLDVVGECGGCIIVDSTRKGKSMPDALSKTIPIWIVVINRLLFPERTDMHVLHTPPDVVSESEHSQISQRIAQFVDEAKALQLDVASLRQRLRDRPLSPVWITPAGRQVAADGEDAESYHTIVLCTASSADTDCDMREYVQGAADDHESWGQGLNAVLFWHNHETLMKAAEADLPALIDELALASKSTVHSRTPVLISPTATVSISDDLAAEAVCEDFDFIVSCGPTPIPAVATKLSDRYCHLACPAGKFGSRQLRIELSKLEGVISRLKAESKVLVACPSGKDLAVGTALALICLRFDGDGKFIEAATAPAMNKTDIKHRLSWIMVSMPDASPSRATLQSVNAFLMG